MQRTRYVSRMVRWATVVFAGALVGSLAGAVAGPHGTSIAPVDMRVLHVSPVLTVPGSSLELAAATLCDPPESVGCQVVRATLQVRDPAGRLRAIAGLPVEGAFRWRVPSELVTTSGFGYYLEFRTAGGQTVRYPSEGAAAPLMVATTAGFTESAVPSLSWDQAPPPGEKVVDLDYGVGPGEVGLTGGLVDQAALTASSFAVADEGAIFVADWVNGRIQEFSAEGRFVRSIPAPVDRSFDLVARTGSLDLLTLGSDGVAFRVSRMGGRVLARARVPEGIATRLLDGSVLVGPGQLLPLFPGRRVGTGPDVPEPELSQDLAENVLAARWERPDGTLVGAVVTLPVGFRVGPDYFVEPLPDGGAVVTRGVWDDLHSAVGVFTFDVAGSLVGVELLPEPSSLMDAVFSTVRWRDGSVLVARDRVGGLTIDAFEVV